MTTQYKKFIKLIAKWPLDTTKGERDLGKFIRDRVKEAFESPPSARQALDTEWCARQHAALARLADNAHRQRHRRTRTSTATGLSAEECNLVLSDEVLAYLREENKGFFSKILKGKEAK